MPKCRDTSKHVAGELAGKASVCGVLFMARKKAFGQNMRCVYHTRPCWCPVVPQCTKSRTVNEPSGDWPK